MDPRHFQPGNRRRTVQRDRAGMRSDDHPQTSGCLGHGLDDHAAEIDFHAGLALGVVGQQFDARAVDQFQRRAGVQDHDPRAIGRQRQERLVTGEKLLGQYPPPAGIVGLELQQHVLPVRREAADLRRVLRRREAGGGAGGRRRRCPIWGSGGSPFTASPDDFDGGPTVVPPGGSEGGGGSRGDLFRLSTSAVRLRAAGRVGVVATPAGEDAVPRTGSIRPLSPSLCRESPPTTFRARLLRHGFHNRNRDLALAAAGQGIGRCLAAAGGRSCRQLGGFAGPMAWRTDCRRLRLAVRCLPVCRAFSLDHASLPSGVRVKAEHERAGRRRRRPRA